jgi:oxygen-dependent protoporphyrinogen oxidase
MKNNRVLIIGGGISGLSTAYWLTKLGVSCRVVERQERFGGLLSSRRESHGLVETAANGFIANADILEMCQDVGVSLAQTKKTKKNRYVFRKQPRRWPLNFTETLIFLKGVLKGLFQRRKFFSFAPQESVQEWALPRFGEEGVRWLLAPALQGVYAGNVRRLSARLIFSSMKEKQKKSALKGTQAPINGMGDLVERLVEWLKDHGALLEAGLGIEDLEKNEDEVVVVATSAFDLKSLARHAPDLVPALEAEGLPLVSATLFFEKQPEDLKGFGCLFPEKEGFYSLGVLFNESIFENRSQKRSETWILGGAFRKDVCTFSDEEILRQIREDRKRLRSSAEEETPLSFHITRWPQALPHLSVDLEKQILGLKLSRGIFLAGNYLGRIGLGQMVSRHRRLAEQIKEEFY